MPIKQLALVVLTTLAAGTIATTASAATWHQGTPKVLRGNYQNKHKSQAQGFADRYIFTAKRGRLQV